MKDAKQKAEDYVSVLAGQKVGKAVIISNNSSTIYPRPIYASMMKSDNVAYEQMPERETLAIGEIEVVSSVSVSFVLE